ncbi:MAG: hypothetical protein GTO02_03640 [Candidatus Dadabacteria bacterium]|nr:hypothetical protein [Candidatus Dadabacteria bacterium]NIQ13520.1 hypothetical protein [Candidatus Dadabacteria bacterium]
MIKINLLPKQEIRKPKSNSEFFIGILALILIIGVLFLTHFNQVGKIKSTRAQIASADKRIKELKKVEKKVNEFKRKNKELERRIKIISDLEKMRSGPLFVMDSLSQSVPERVWVNEFISKGNTNTIKGIAWDEFIVADFLESLQKSEYYKNVQIRVIEKQVVNRLTVRKFTIGSNLNFLGKQVKKKKKKKSKIEKKLEKKGS